MSKRSNAANVSLVSGNADVAAAKELLSISAASGIAGMRAVASPKAVQTNVPVAVGNSDIDDELQRGGPALAALVTGMGGSIAKAQAALDANLVTTAKALSDTKIDVIAVFEQVLDDDGKMSAGNPIVESLPLTNYVPLPAYAFTEAKLVVDMQVSEFNSANGFNVQSKSMSASAGLAAGYSRKKGFSISGTASGSISSSDVSGNSSYGQDYAAGQVHLEMTLEPRDINLPKPLIIQKGPTIDLAIEAIENLDANGVVTTGATVAGRRATIRADVRKADGTANSGKPLSAVLNQPALTYSFHDGSGALATTTATDGTIHLIVERKGTAFTPDPMLTEVNLRLGLAGASTSVTL